MAPARHSLLVRCMLSDVDADVCVLVDRDGTYDAAAALPGDPRAHTSAPAAQVMS